MTTNIDWNTDRHTLACRAAGLPTPWVDEQQGQQQQQGQQSTSNMPNLDKWVAKSKARFKHHQGNT